jgi:hypothetical protein
MGIENGSFMGETLPPPAFKMPMVPQDLYLSFLRRKENIILSASMRIRR